MRVVMVVRMNAVRMIMPGIVTVPVRMIVGVRMVMRVIVSVVMRMVMDVIVIVMMMIVCVIMTVVRAIEPAQHPVRQQKHHDAGNEIQVGRDLRVR